MDVPALGADFADGAEGAFRLMRDAAVWGPLRAVAAEVRSDCGILKIE